MMYGSRDQVALSIGQIEQNDYAAIVLVNPPPDSPPLELSATVFKDRPRRVTLVDAEDKPVIGAKSSGIPQIRYSCRPCAVLAIGW